MVFQQFLAITAIALSLASLFPYMRDVFRGRTRPHMFTWIVWTSMTFIAFAAQVTDGGGPGAWATGVTAMACVPIVLASIFKGEHDIKPLDWFCLIMSAVAGLAWAVNNDPTMSVVLISLIDAIAFVPTIRKSIHKPMEETLSNYVLSATKHGFSIMAMSKISIVTILYPAVVGLMNGVMVVLLMVRRAAQQKEQEQQRVQVSAQVDVA